MLFFKKTILTSALIAVYIFFAQVSEAITFEVFQSSVQSKKSAKKANSTVECGLYLTDVITNRNYVSIRDDMEEFANLLEGQGLTNGVDYYYANSFLFYLPRNSKLQNKEVTEGIASLKNALGKFNIRPELKKNIALPNYVRSFPVQYSSSTEELITPLTLTLPPDTFEGLSTLASLNQKLLDDQSTKKEYGSQIAVVSKKSTEISLLLRKYSDFGELYRELEQMRPKIERIMSSSDQKCDFKEMVRFLVTGSVDIDFFNENDTHISAGRTKKFSDKEISYNELNNLLNKYLKKNTELKKTDESLKMLSKYLQLVNVVFLNRNSLPELKALSNDPYNDISVLSISQASAIRNNITQIMFSANYSFIQMGSNIYEDHLMRFENKSGKSAVVSFSKTSNIANLNRLKDIAPLLKSAISIVDSEITDDLQNINTNPYCKSFGSNSSPVSFLRNYWLLSNINYEADEAEILNKPFIADILFNYQSVMKSYFSDDYSQVIASFDQLRNNIGKKNKAINVFPYGAKWVVIGRFK